MQKTKKLYYEDSHLFSFEATVLDCKKENNCYQIVLDETVFFPEGGGQPADKGQINGIEVTDVQEKEEMIYHSIKEELSIGSRIKGEVDFGERFECMQNHSGEHIVSGLVKAHFGYENVGFHLGSDIVTMDFDGELSKEDLSNIEFQANEAIAKNLEIKISFPSREELALLSYRSKIEIEGSVRIVEIPGYDLCACCAPHVKRTGEIGMIKLLSGQKYKKGTRVSMLCGFRALRDYNQKADNISEISVLLSAKQEAAAEAVAHLKKQLELEKMEKTNIKQQLFAYKVKEIAAEENKICLFEAGLNTNEVRQFVNLLMEKENGLCIVLSGDDENGYQYVAGSQSMDVRCFGEALLKQFEGRGGGKAGMIQGSIKGRQADIESFITGFGV